MEQPLLDPGEVVGLDEPAPLLDGRWVRYVNLDNAATTPALRSVVDAVHDLLPIYSSVHRGTGYKSRVTTAAYEAARRRVGAFVGADPDRDAVMFVKHTTDAINTLARSLVLAPGAVVLTTMLEHHSNDLPWRARTRVVHVAARPDGTLDEDDLDHQLARWAGRIGLVAVTGASWPPTARSTCGPTTTPGTSTSSCCPPTRRTPRSGPGR
jgi:cysteine desulfurase/selenocysteine lyase